MVDHIGRNEQGREIGNLIRRHNRERDEEARRQAIGPALAVQRARQQEQRDSEEAITLDLADMLNTPRRGGAKGEDESSHKTGRRMPAAVKREIESGQPTTCEQGDDIGIEHEETRLRKDQGKDKGGRKDQ